MTYVIRLWRHLRRLLIIALYDHCSSAVSIEHASPTIVIGEPICRRIGRVYFRIPKIYAIPEILDRNLHTPGGALTVCHALKSTNYDMVLRKEVLQRSPRDQPKW
jgi:hypothetical protein